MTKTVDMHLNKYLELVKVYPEKTENLENVNEINIYVITDENLYNQKIMTIINYHNHVKIIEYYESPLGEVYIEKTYNVKPSDIIQFLFPKVYEQYLILLTRFDETITVRCFTVHNQIICVDDFANNVINLTTKEYRARLTVCEYKKMLQELQEAGAKEVAVEEVEKHRYEPRTYYRIYKVNDVYFMEIFDGSSATYEYSFCNSKQECLETMKTRETGNKMLY